MTEEQNVIPFPRSERRRDKPSRQELRNRDLLRLRKIEERGDSKKGRVFGLTDRINAGHAARVMLDDAKRHGISMQSVKDRFGRIARYSLSPGTDPASKEARKQAEVLTQKVSGYLKLAETVADLMGKDVDDAKIDILKDTSLWSTGGGPPSAHHEDERAWHLVQMLREMGRFIIRRERLVDFFATARKVPGQWDFHAGRIRPGNTSCLPEPGYEGSFDVWEQSPPLPSTALVRIDPVQISSRIVIDKDEASDPPENYFEPRDDFEGEICSGRVRVSREIRLCLGPARDPDDLGAMFESRAHVELELAESEFREILPVVPSCSLDVLVDVGGYIRLNDKWRRFRFADDVDPGQANLDAWSCMPLREDSPRIEHYYLSWTPVNSGYVTHWLDREEGEYQVTLGGSRPAPRTQWFAASTLAHFVERALVTGSLEAALIKQIRTIRAALICREKEWRTNAREETRSLLNLWSGDTESEE